MLLVIEHNTAQGAHTYDVRFFIQENPLTTILIFIIYFVVVYLAVHHPAHQ